MKTKYLISVVALALGCCALASADAPAAATGVAADPGSGAPNIIVAIQKQLGLRLDKVADIPLDVIVVESIDKTPTDN